MTKQKQDKLQNITDILAEDILNLSDEEILNDENIDSDTIKKIVNEGIDILNKSIAIVGRKKLDQAQATLSSQKSVDTSNIINLPLNKKKEIIQKLEEGEGLTLAARKENELTEAEFDAKLEAMIQLGKIDEDGNPI